MTESVQAFGWELEFDAEATRTAHREMKNGGPEQCGCQYCLQWISNRAQIYPADVSKLFRTLGISMDRETELGSPIEFDGNRLLYNGWFHFVGKIISGPATHKKVTDVKTSGNISGGHVEQFTLHEVSPGFSIGFNTKRHLLPKSFDGKDVVQLEFTCEFVPQLLKERQHELGA